MEAEMGRKLVITAITAEPDEDYLIYPENPPHVIMHLAPDPVQVAAAEECWNNGGAYDFMEDTCDSGSGDGCGGDPECECVTNGGEWDSENQLCNDFLGF